MEPGSLKSPSQASGLSLASAAAGSLKRASKRTMGGGGVDSSLAGFKNLKDLQASGILNVQFMTKAEKGGQVQVKLEEINKVFQVIEHNKKGQSKEDGAPLFHYDESYISKIRLADFKQRMAIINPAFPINDLNTLFQGRSDVTSKDMHELLQENEMLEDFDPMQEAIAILTNAATGEIDMEKVLSLMSQLGYGEFDKKDKEILKECLDVDKDGKVTDKDIKDVVTYINKKKYLLP